MATEKDLNESTRPIGSHLSATTGSDSDATQIATSGLKQENVATEAMAPHPQTASPPEDSPVTKPTTGGLYLGAKIKDRYLIEKELGRGGVGVVYFARDLQLMSRPVVIKILLEESSQNEWFKKKFYQEMEALARLDHPGIVGVLDAGQTDDGKPYIVMQYIEGVSLRAMMKSETIDLKRTANIIRQVCQALTAAHDKGIYHRDLKPENIMMQRLSDGEEQAKLIDFGIATVKDSQVATVKETTTVAGTAWYMAPEQLMGKPAAATDIYAVGVIAYELITGHRPFNPITPYELLGLQKEGVKVLPCELCHHLPAAAEEAILKALSFEPAARQARAREFGDELERALTSSVSTSGIVTQRYSDRAATADQRAPDTANNQRDLRATAAAPALAPVISTSVSPARKSARNYIIAGVAGIVVVGAVITAVIAYFMSNQDSSTSKVETPTVSASTAPEPPPLLTTEIYEEFLNLNRWVVPESGWTDDPRENALEIASQPEPGYLRDVNCDDFSMVFHLKLLGAAGAAWTLRMQDTNNYYLFYLSGPDGQHKNRFLTYIVRDGKFTPTEFANSLPLTVHLKQDGEYDIKITVEKNIFTHTIIDDQTGLEYNLGLWKDVNNTYPTGGVGFRAINIENFLVDDLYVRPPGVQLPK